MGQYFMAVNTTKKEYLQPHKFGSGLKFREFAYDSMSVLTGMAHLLAQSSDGVAFDSSEITGRWIGDHVLIVGDYDKSDIYGIAYETYTDISDKVIEHMCFDPDVYNHLSKVTRWDGTGSVPVAIGNNPTKISTEVN